MFFFICRIVDSALPNVSRPQTPPTEELFICPIDHVRQLVPVAGTFEQMQRHMKETHEVDLIAEGLEPVKVEAGELNVPYLYKLMHF